jgi:hypothetical protein
VRETVPNFKTNQGRKEDTDRYHGPPDYRIH